MESLPCEGWAYVSEQDGPARGKEHINGKSGGERNKKAALWRAEAAVHTKGTAAADRPAAGGAAAGSDRGYGRYHDGVPLRRSGHFRCQPCGYDQQPHHRAVCGAGHWRRSGGKPVFGCAGAEGGRCKLWPAAFAQRRIRFAGGGILFCFCKADDPAVLRCHRCRCAGCQRAVPAHHRHQLSVSGTV